MTALKVILSFISKDSKVRASNFKKQLDEKINGLVIFPYKFRQSVNYESENVRDMIFKGYTVTNIVL